MGMRMPLEENCAWELMHCFRCHNNICYSFGILASMSADDSQKYIPPDGCFRSWLRSSLWLQFKPHHIAAGAAYLAAKFLNFDLAAYQTMWQEFQTTPSIVQDVVQQLMELL